jgi:uncharacterized protein YkwD
MLGKLRLLILPVLAAAALLAPATGASAADCEGQNLMPTSENEAQIRHAVLCLLNAERRKRGLKPLRENAKLRRAANGHSRNMVENGFFDHTTPSGTTMVDRIKNVGYTQPDKGYTLGENIAWGTGDLATPKQTMKAWMNSPGHKANILRAKFREVGIGINLGAPVRLQASEAGATYTTDFGRLISAR